VGDGLRRVEDRLEQVLAAGLLADHRQVWADGAAEAADGVALGTLHVVLRALGKELLAAFEVALALDEGRDGREAFRINLARRREGDHGAVAQVLERTVPQQPADVWFHRLGQMLVVVQLKEPDGPGPGSSQSLGGR